MNNTFYNQTIMITGASSGIGKALAIQIAQEAKCLVLVARRVDRLEELAAILKVKSPNLQTVVAPCDLADIEAIDQMLSTLQNKGIVIDILINNAGLGKQELFETISFMDVKRMIDINVTSVCYLTRRLLPSMVQSAKGGVIFIGIGAGHAWMPGATVYVGTKHFINGFAETLRAELNNTGLTITQVCPGPVDTEFDHAAGSELKGGAPKMERIYAVLFFDIFYVPLFYSRIAKKCILCKESNRRLCFHFAKDFLRRIRQRSFLTVIQGI